MRLPANLKLSAWLFICAMLTSTTLFAQGDRFATADQQTRELLSKRITIDLRDVTLLESLFAIRDLAGLNIVAGNEISGTVNATFADTQVFQILDSLLIPRGYSYRVISGSLVVLPIDSVGDRLPNFTSKTIQLSANAPVDMLPIIESMLSPEGRVHLVPASNSLLLMDYSDRIQEIEQQIQVLENTAAATGSGTPIPGNSSPQQGSLNSSAGTAIVPTEMRVFRPQYVSVQVLMDSLQPVLTQAGRISALQSEDKLIIADTPDNLERLAQVLAELDQPRMQVRIWARIYDCSIEDLKACGVNLTSGVNGSAVDAVSGDPNHSIVLQAVTSPVGVPTNGVLTLTTNSRLGGLSSVFQALETSDDSRLLADPNVVVMNHEAAEIQIVTEVPYQQLTQGIQGGTIGTTAFREAGVSMTVTPHIAQDSTIAMVINPRFSVLTGFAEGSNAPIIDRRETVTTVRVENLNTLVLGGLRQRTRTSEQSGIPGLKKIPYMGHLFRFERNRARESELIVFITPEIVSSGYMGTGREACVGETIRNELDLTPTDPVPFGFDILRAEAAARCQEINHPPKPCNGDKCHCGHCKKPLGIIGDFDF
ncbi:MAG: type II secretion system protein GspD [Planctomycetales bacterium]|nr:type II secretion system protein GspD [Planctomycetales bacterium]